MTENPDATPNVRAEDASPGVSAAPKRARGTQHAP